MVIHPTAVETLQPEQKWWEGQIKDIYYFFIVSLEMNKMKNKTTPPMFE